MSRPTGELIAFEAEQWNGGTKTVGKIGVMSINGVDQALPDPLPVDCYLPVSGVATDALVLAGRPPDRLDRRSGPEGRRRADDRGRSVRARVAAGR